MKALLGSVLAGAIFAACFLPARTLSLRFGPRLASSVSNFAGPWQLRDGDIFQWTTENSFVDLPFWVHGRLQGRLVASSPAGSTHLAIYVEGLKVGSEVVPGPRPRELLFSWGTRLRPLRLAFSAQGRRAPGAAAGLRLHSIQIGETGGTLLPAPLPVVSLMAALLACWSLLVALGSSPTAGVLAVCGFGLVPACALALLDPFAAAHLAVRLAPYFPVAGACAALITRVLERPSLGLLPPGSSRSVVALVMLALLVRGAWLLHPDYFYKDTAIHNAITELGLERGVADIWSRIQEYQLAHDLGTTYVPGGLPSIRYPPAFYTLAIGPARLEEAFFGAAEIDHWSRLLGALVSALQLIPLAVVVAALDPSRRALLLMAALQITSPIDLHYLAQAAWPASLGKLSDLCFIAFALAASRARNPPWALGTCAFLLLSLLTYPAAWPALGVLLVSFGLIEALRRDGATLARVTGGALAAAALAHLLFYGDLLVALVREHLPAMLAGASRGASTLQASPAVWFWGPVRKYFSSIHVALAIVGLFTWRHRRPSPLCRAWLWAWALTLPLLLLAAHLGGPGLMYIRPLFFPSSFLIVATALALTWLWEWSPPVGRPVAIGLLLALLVIQIGKIGLMAPAFFENYRGTIGIGFIV